MQNHLNHEIEAIFYQYLLLKIYTLSHIYTIVKVSIVLHA